MLLKDATNQFCILKAAGMKRYHKAASASTKTFLPPLLTPEIPRKD